MAFKAWVSAVIRTYCLLHAEIASTIARNLMIPIFILCLIFGNLFLDFCDIEILIKGFIVGKINFLSGGSVGENLLLL